MHYHLVLVESGVCGFFCDVVEDGLIGSASVEKTETVEGASV